ncbi:CDP-glycerol glycerophosphotransferase family protein [Streptomyces sp. NPDC056921]|uniref:CDP-glycerol glycerophosphotransferase family protein n=1 Tax=Streptomyces sp. NPDC056921 TaxID=3345966 RepID=UPI0036377376
MALGCHASRCRRAIRRELSLGPDRTVLLYAPTHRDHGKGLVPHLDPRRLARELGPRYVVLVRAHRLDGRSIPLDGAGVMDVTGHPSVEELCLVSDALITDYSSLMFDCACLDRPIISHVPDREAYRASRGTYFDLLPGRHGDTPGAVSTTEDELLELFRTGEWCSARTAGLRAAFRERFCPYDDGHAAERVVRRLFLGDSDGDGYGYGYGDSYGDCRDSEPDRTATGARPMSPVRERPGPVTPGPSRG